MNSEDYVWSQEHLNKVSRTFALSLQELPDKHEKQMTVAYLLCRVPDTIEDTDKISSTEKEELLEAYKSVINSKLAPAEFVQQIRDSVPDVDTVDNPDWNLVLETEQLITIFNTFSAKEQQTISKWVIELTEGMREFVVKNDDIVGVRIQSIEELDKYCYFVAGTVGHMIIDLLDNAYDIPYNMYSYDQVHHLAEEYGLMLQYINITKDVYDDFYSEDNIYIPETIITDFDLSQSEFVTGDHEKTEEIIEIVNEQTEAYLESSEEFLQWIQENYNDAYRGWAIPHFLAVATLRELRKKADLAIESEEVKINRTEVQTILEKIDTTGITELRDEIFAEKTVSQ